MKLLLFSILTVFCAVMTINAQEYFWEQKISGGGRGNPIDYDRNNTNLVYYGSTEQVYKSIDYGDHFFPYGSPLPNADGVKRILTYENSGATLLVAYFGDSGGDKIAKTTDNGLTWTITASNLTFSYFGIPMTRDNTDPDVVYTMDGNNFMVSTDFGSTWNTISNPPISGAPCDIEKFANSDVILIGDNGTGITRSTDGGQTWTEVYSTSGEIPMISTDKLQPGFAYATKWGGGGGALKTTDYGQTWNNIGYFGGSNTWGVNVAPTFSDLVVVGQFFGDNHISHDGGNTWIATSIPSSNYAIVIIDTMNIFAAQGDGFYKLNSPYYVPVELTSFAASIVDNKINLNWETASETNNQGFEIQKSLDNKNFEKIDFVPGFGTTTEKKSYTYTIEDELNQKTYYRLKQVDYDGSYEYSKTVEVDGITPSEYNISQNYPNPFNPSTSIKFSLPVDSKVKITLYNMIGEKLSKLLDKNFTPGNHSVDFNASELSSGNYIYVIEANGIDGSNYQKSMKMTLLK